MSADAPVAAARRRGRPGGRRQDNGDGGPMPSEFDLRIIVGFAAAMGTIALALAEARRDREGGPMTRSALAIAALLAAAVGMMLRGAVPLPVSVFVANAGITGGLCLAYAAC